MKEYIKPEVTEISFVSEVITVDGEQGTSGFDGNIIVP